MGDAKRRQAEIAELKKKPLERKRVKRLLGKAKTEQVYHFRCEAARREVNFDLVDEPLRNSDAVTRAVKLGQVEQRLVQAIPLKIFTPVEIEPSRKPRQPLPLPLVSGAKGEDLAHLVIALAQINPRGFRQPSAKEKNWKSTSLVEKLSIAFLGAKANTFKRSKRGEKKLEHRNEANAAIVLARLVDAWPDRALQARHSDKMLDWFVGKVQDTYPTVNIDWLRQAAKEYVKYGHHPKYWHAAARRRAEQEDAEAA